MSLFAFPRFVQSEFGGLFRLADELAAVSRHNAYRQAPRIFAPKFSYRENKENFELQGELPGVESKDIEIEWTDASTLRVRGRTETHREHGTKPVAATPETPAVEGQTETAQVEAAPSTVADSETSSTYHKASVEDDADTTMSGANPDATPADTPAETPADGSVVAAEATPASKEEPTYYFSERSVGQFARTFNFPSRVDTENVKASLKNGILSIVVPKSQAPVSRRINIE